MSFSFAGHNKANPGFSQAMNPFAGLGDAENATVLEFDDTYDGLGDHLQETGDELNDDTFGGDTFADIPTAGQNAVPEFDFFGQTAKVADAMQEEQVRFNRQHSTTRRSSAAAPPPVSQQPFQDAFTAGSLTTEKRPARAGYEQYRKQEQVADMEVDASIWGVAPKKLQQQTQQPQKSQHQKQQKQQHQRPQTEPQVQARPPAAAPAKKFLSLEEVEAQMKAQAKASHQPASLTQSQQLQTGWSQDYGYQQASQTQQNQGRPEAQVQQGPAMMPMLQRPQKQMPPTKHTPPISGPSPFGSHHAAQNFPQEQQHQQHPQFAQQMPVQIQPTHVMQNLRRMQEMGILGHSARPAHGQQGSFAGQNPISHQQQPSVADSKRLEQDAKRAKRNHKIFLMSRDNGLMTPRDKNFVSRIQLQQLVAATGNSNESGFDDMEDFYFEVLSQIRGGQRQHPNQPLNNFALTYLFQTGNRHHLGRRHGRPAENHVQRMEQQVQRAVEAAKNKPKTKQLVIEGSLGKISFSNAKTPKPLLNIKLNESGSHHAKPQTNTIDRKDVLKTIEQMYTTLMELEDMERRAPPPMTSDHPELPQKQAEIHQNQLKLLSRLWQELRIHEPIGAAPVHPFIALLAFAKGKKAIPRIFRLISDEQRKVVLTMIIVHLDKLDVVRLGVDPDANARDSIELFSAAVMPSLFSFFNTADMGLAIGCMGIIVSSVNVELVARSRIGVSFLTMILSRPELVKNSGEADEATWQEWVRLYNIFFDRLEASLPLIFPGSVHKGEDVYVWQFLAAIGVGATPDQQSRLVIAVKHRVMETVSVAKTLPASMASQRLAHVNLFMRSIGLDVELLS